MLDSFFIKELFNVGVLELCSIVTSNSLDLDIKLILGTFCKLLEDATYFTLVTQKEYRSETRIIINNYETIFVTTKAYISNGSKYVHVKQFQWPFGCHNILDGMFSSNLFSHLACVDRICSVVHRGVSHDGRFVGGGAHNQEPDGDTRHRDSDLDRFGPSDRHNTLHPVSLFDYTEYGMIVDVD